MEGRDVDARMPRRSARLVLVDDVKHVRPQFSVDGDIPDFDDPRPVDPEQGAGDGRGAGLMPLRLVRQS